MKKITYILSVVFLLGLMTGCANYAEDYDRNTLIVKKNGSLIEVAVEDFSKTSVKADALSVYITEQIDNFNEKQDKKVVKNKDLLTEDMSKVKLVLEYKDIDGYNGFNLLECKLTDFADVDEKELKGTFTSADGKSVKVGKMEDTKGAKVLMISEKTDVILPGDILYYNKEVSMKKGVASASGKGNAIIIYK
ncbi:MAG: hypothetical protein E7264_10085 [Lachnospiraceae bacterium]|nr:hypothetical protein [Lachnospiraceae bacterium]